MTDNELEQEVVNQEEQTEESSNKSGDKKKVWKYVLNIVLVLIVTAVALVITLSKNVTQIFAYIGDCDWLWILAIIGLLVAMACIRSLVLFCFARLYTRDYKYHQALACDQIGVFYCGVTPGASGGQIMQSYTYKKQGVQISNAVSILAMYSIVYQIVLIAFGVISFIAKYDQITEIGAIPFDIGGWQFSIPIWPLTIIGFSLNVMVILLVLLMGYWHKFHNFVLGPCINLLSKMKIIKKPDKTRENLRIQVENFKIEFRRLITNIPLTLLVLFFFVVIWIIYSSVPYFVGGALHNESFKATFWDAVFLSNYHQMVTGIIPIPGAAGVSEYFFAKLFLNSGNPAMGFYYKVVYNVGGTINIAATKEASEALCRASLLLWRTFTFTLPLLVSGFITAFYRASPKGQDSRTARSFNKDTLLHLQNETLALRQDDLEQLQHTIAINIESFKQKLTPSKKPNHKKSNKSKSDEDPNYDDLSLENKKKKRGNK